MEGSQQDPLFRVTGVPLHTHNATALLEVEMSMVSEAVGGTRFVSNAGEFSAPDLNIAAGDLVEAYEDKDDFQEDIDRLQRAIEFGVGRVQLQPENCVNFISEPTRAIAEIRTLVCAKDSLKTMTFVDQTWAYTDRKGVGIDTNFPISCTCPCYRSTTCTSSPTLRAAWLPRQTRGCTSSYGAR